MENCHITKYHLEKGNSKILSQWRRGTMMEKEIDEIMQIYDRFIEIVKQFSEDSHIQIEKLKGFTVADEIASDFSEIGMMYAKDLLDCNWITVEQFEMAKSIDDDLNVMSKQKELWNEDALSNSQEWKICREKGAELLSTLE